jgi:hypothetical protein
VKPIREYLAELLSPYNELALSVVDENYEGYQVQVESLADAIRCMCHWRKTPQGHAFWSAVGIWCLDPNNYPLPPITVVEQPEEGNEFQKAVSKIAQLILKLEQENTKLKADNNALKLETLRANASESDLLNKVAQLESQLLTNPKQ